MKINIKLILSFSLILSLSILNCLKISKNNNSLNNNHVYLSSEYDPKNSPSVLKELLGKVKKLNPENSDLFRECVNLMVNSRYTEAMKTLWDSIKNKLMAENPGKLERSFFVNFINSTDESLVVEKQTISCKNVMNKNLMELGEMDNFHKQREFENLFYPYFAVQRSAVNGKKIITAFIGVHRDSVVAANLIPKLNNRQ
jgi:hypothetical protein